MIGTDWSPGLLFAALALLVSQPEVRAQEVGDVPSFEPEPISRISTYVQNYYADKDALDREYVLEESARYYDRMERFYGRWLEQMNEIDYARLTVDEAVDFILLRRNIRRDRPELRQSRHSFQSVRSTVPFAEIIQEFSKKEALVRTFRERRLAENWTVWLTRFNGRRSP